MERSIAVLELSFDGNKRVKMKRVEKGLRSDAFGLDFGWDRSWRRRGKNMKE